MLDVAGSPKETQMAVEDWPAEIRADLELNRYNPCVGSELLLETDRSRIWSLSLDPGQSLHFHRHVLDYFWTVVAAGRARQYFEDGRFVELDYRVGDIKQLTFGEGEYMVHNAMNIGDTVLSFITVEYLQSANDPIALPADVVRKQP